MKRKYIVLFIFICFILYFCYLSYKSCFVNSVVKQRRINFLLLGVDFVDNAVHSDTIILLSYTPKMRILDVISIPRDMYVDIIELKFRKLTEVYAVLYNRTKSKYNAAKEMLKIIEEKFFVSSNGKKVSIPYFFVIDYPNFEKFIDTIGKIKIVVTEPMHYDDYAGNLHIHFDPGIYFMDGKKVLEYVRYRDKVGDLGRIYRQQQFIYSLIEKLLSPGCILRLPVIIYNFKKCFVTNISLWDFLNMILEFKNLRMLDIRFSTITGIPKGRYLEVDQSMMDMLVEYLLDEKIKLYEGNNDILLKVYNATNKPQLAKQVAMFLRDKGYDVLLWGNWYCQLPQSKIIDCSQNTKVINEISNLLDISNITTLHLTKELSSMRPSVTIILGKDFLEKSFSE